MIVYLIKHVESGQFMPDIRGKGGYTYWDPKNKELESKIGKRLRKTPRLFHSVHDARICVAIWANGIMVVKFDDEGDTELIQKDIGRKRSDLTILKFNLEEVNEGEALPQISKEITR